MLRLRFIGLSATLVAATLSTTAQAQTAAPPPYATTKVEGTDNVYIFRFGGHQSMFIVTKDGVIATDPISERRPAAKTYIEEIQKITKAPIKYVIYSHSHYDHIAGGKPFKDLGATFIAHKNAKARIVALKPDDVVVPDQVVDNKKVIKLGGAEVRAYSFGRGHTGDDTMVYFPDTKVVMVSDQITDNAPLVDFANGGSAVGWAPILDGVLKLDFEMAIPGRGEPKTRADVEAYRTKFATVVTRASDAIKAGATRDTLASQVKTDDIGWNFNAQFYGSLYDELTKK